MFGEKLTGNKKLSAVSTIHSKNRSAKKICIEVTFKTGSECPRFLYTQQPRCTAVYRAQLANYMGQMQWLLYYLIYSKD